MPKLITGFLLSLSLSVQMPIAQAQGAALLTQPLTIIVGYPAGGDSDRVARIIGDKLKDELGVPVIVENKLGAGGRISAQIAKKATATDNVLLIGNPAIMVIAPLVMSDIGYDPIKDFNIVSMVSNYRFAVAVSTGSNVKRMADLVYQLGYYPAKYNIGVPATGSLPHFFVMMMEEKIGAPVQVIGYKGSAPLLNDLAGGHLNVAMDTFNSLLPMHQAGKVKIIAVSGETPEPSLPDVPTFKQSNLSLTGAGWNAFFAPASMPQDKVKVLSKAINKVMKDATVQQTIQGMMLDPVVADLTQSQEIFASFKKQWEPVIKQSGFRAEP